MSKLGITCAAFAIVGLATLPVVQLSAADVEAQVVAISSAKHTVTVSSSAIEGGTAVVKMESTPASLKVGDPIVVTWNKEVSAFVLVNTKK